MRRMPECSIWGKDSYVRNARYLRIFEERANDERKGRHLRQNDGERQGGLRKCGVNERSANERG